MSIREINQYDIPNALALWNESVEKKDILYTMLDEQTFTNKFYKNEMDIEIKTYVHIDNQMLNGFLSGVIDQSKGKAYLTTILVASIDRKSGIASKLLNQFEAYVRNHHPSVQTVEVVFFNPIHLKWIVPNTKSHMHPNAPGIDYESAAYFFFKHHKYLEYAKQNTYYKNILSYTYSDHIEKSFEYLKEKSISITFYNPEKHSGFDELFADLNNTNWKNEITRGINEQEPILIAEIKGKIIGFTGPLRVESNLRGYFAGIGVHSNYRGYGIGKVLFSTLCLELKNIGAHYMTLFTGETNPARLIYEKEGFKIVRSWANMKKNLVES